MTGYKFYLLQFLFLICMLPYTEGQTIVNRFNNQGIRFYDLSDALFKKSRITAEHECLDLWAPAMIPLSGGITVSYVSPDKKNCLVFARNSSKETGWKYDTLTVVHSHSGVTGIKGVTLFNVTERKQPPRLLLFNTDSIFLRSISSDQGNTWGAFEIINGYGGERIIHIHRKDDGVLIAFFCSNENLLKGGSGEGKSLVYKIYSYDNGISWGLPRIAVKHNIYSLEDAAIAYYNNRKKSKLYMIVHEPDNASALFSVSEDDGETWSYPTQLPSLFNGDRHQIAIYKDDIYVVFRDISLSVNANYISQTYGDIMLWKGTVKDIERKQKGDYIVRLIDNSPSGNHLLNNADINKYGYITMLPINKKEILFVGQGKWETARPAYIRSFILNTDKMISGNN